MPNDPSSQSPQPLTDAQYAAASVLIVEMSSPLSWGPEVNELANVGRRLLAEVDRLRAENTALAASLDQFRSFPTEPGPGEWSTSYRMGYADAGRDVRALVRALGLDQDGRGQTNGAA